MPQFPLTPTQDATAPTVALEVRNLVVDFPLDAGLYRAVNDVSFTLNQGETLCLVGESGSGKSVTAQSILQILDPPGRVTSGQILFHNSSDGGAPVDIAGLHPRSRAIRDIRGKDIAMIFQEPMSSLSPVHTIGWQIIEILMLHENITAKAARARAIDLLGQVAIRDPERAVDKYPFEFSGGMRQRAMIAMALACNPSVLIADEPTTALDVSVQAEILGLLRKLQAERGTAILFITHDMGVVAEIADRIVVMRHGKAVEQGDVHSVFNAPQHRYTTALLDSVRRLDQPSPRRLRMRQEASLGAPILSASRLRKDFGVQTAVKDVEIELKQGENLGIVGESGSGKTTLGRCLQRLYDVSDGRIIYTDRQGTQTDLAPLSKSQLRTPWRDIRTVFQDPFGSLNPRMTVGQIISEPLSQQTEMSSAAQRARVAELLELVGLPANASNRYPHAFSGGQRQRISIARAIAPNPRIIIADEATSALDVKMRGQILDLMLDLQERLGLSYILISHDLSVIRYFCDRVAVMYQGEIVETGPTESVCNHPQHPYTKALLSAVPVADPDMRGRRERLRYEPA